MDGGGDSLFKKLAVLKKYSQGIVGRALSVGHSSTAAAIALKKRGHPLADYYSKIVSVSHIS